MGFNPKDKTPNVQASMNSFSEKSKEYAGAAGRGVVHAGKATGRGIGHVASAVKDASAPVGHMLATGAKNVGTIIKGATRFHNSDLKHNMQNKRHRAIDKD